MSVLITGASSGIGHELALVFAEHGYDVIAVGRSRERLEGLARELQERFGARTDVLQHDLFEPGAAERLWSDVRARGLAPDILVNNAGALEIGAFRDIPLERTLEIVQLNVVALTALTRLALPGMLLRGTGRILNVASVAAFAPAPSLAVYGATKAFVLSLSEALVEELAGTGVFVTALCPGGTESAILDQIRRSGANAERLYALVPPAAARDVAKEGYEACMRGLPIHVPGIGNQLAEAFVRTHPRWLVRSMLGAFGRQFM